MTGRLGLAVEFFGFGKLLPPNPQHLGLGAVQGEGHGDDLVLVEVNDGDAAGRLLVDLADDQTVDDQRLSDDFHAGLRVAGVRLFGQDFAQQEHIREEEGMNVQL